MDENYLGCAVFVFLIILSILKYNCVDTLKESIMEYLSDILPQETIEEPDEIIELEELTECIATLIMENKERFYKVN